MSLPIGKQVQIRSMVFVAGEPIPFFWPMRTFIHHNPLHGLEQLKFEDAVAKGKHLFHGAGFLPRTTYQGYYRDGKIEPSALATGVEKFLTNHPAIEGLDLKHWMMKLAIEIEPKVITPNSAAKAEDVVNALHQRAIPPEKDFSTNDLENQLTETLCQSTIYETLDNMFGTGIGEELDELVIKSCLDFFDEGQSVWEMPNRKLGFFKAWREVARRNLRLFIRGRQIQDILEAGEEPEEVIVHVMKCLGIPQQSWMDFFRLELTRLHGWAGFIRWRSTARHYYPNQQHPGDLVDYLAVRLTQALALIRERDHGDMPSDLNALEQYVQQRPMETYLRREFYGKTILPAWAQRVETVLLSGSQARIDELGRAYCQEKRVRDAAMQASALRSLGEAANAIHELESLSETGIAQMLDVVSDFENREGIVWLKAMEAAAMGKMMKGIQYQVPDHLENRPFAQALFCIDTRSERLRRQLEGVGNYETFGIAGFFGIPVSFMELGKGSETHLCPILLTPKNLVMEMSVNEIQGTVALTALEKALHELKESVLTPFVTVEAIGLLFGLDMVGKTLAPSSYNKWRSGLHDHKPHTHMLIDKLSREQADSIVRAVQRAVIAKAIEHEYETPAEDVTDDVIRELREVALGHSETTTSTQEHLQINNSEVSALIDLLRSTYRITAADSRLQMERLGRIGFTLDEQVAFVSQALSAIGLTENFSRFVLLVGHGSQSQNNPYESALDCGACGGNLGLFNARIFANMANKPTVRQRLKEMDISIPDEAWFVPALHNTTTDEVSMHDLDLLPASHLIYLDRLQSGLVSASRLCAQERLPTLDSEAKNFNPVEAGLRATRNAMDWSQARPEWGLSRNAYFVIGRRALTEKQSLDGRSFLHSYDYRVDKNQRLLVNILTGPLVVAQWINMEHYFSAVDNEHYGSGSKVYHNVAGRFGVMTGNLSDLRTGLPAQTVLMDGQPYHEPMRLMTVIEGPFDHVVGAISEVPSVRRLLNNDWIRMLVIDPETNKTHLYEDGAWQDYSVMENATQVANEEMVAS